MKGVFVDLTSLYDAISFLVLVLKPSPLRWMFFGLLIYIVVKTFLEPPLFEHLDKPSFDGYTEGTHLVETILRILDPLFISDLRRKGQTKPLHELDFKDRIKWAVSYKVSTRGIGWQHEPTHALPRPQKLSRSKFLRIHFIRLLCYILGIDICCLVLRFYPPFLGENSVSTNLWNLFQKFNRTWILCYFGFNMGYTTIALGSVGLGVSMPEEWPAFFGPINEAYTIQRFWGRTWHQLFRKPFSAPSLYVSRNILRLKPKTKASFYVTLYGTFLISGLYHTAGEYKASNKFSSSALYFFLLQAVAISLEDIVHIVATRRGLYKEPSKTSLPAWRWVGYAWVIAWLLFPPPMVENPEVFKASDMLWWKVSPITAVLRLKERYSH